MEDELMKKTKAPITTSKYFVNSLFIAALG